MVFSTTCSWVAVGPRIVRAVPSAFRFIRMKPRLDTTNSNTTPASSRRRTNRSIIGPSGRGSMRDAGWRAGRESRPTTRTELLRLDVPEVRPGVAGLHLDRGVRVDGLRVLEAVERGEPGVLHDVPVQVLAGLLGLRLVTRAELGDEVLDGRVVGLEEVPRGRAADLELRELEVRRVLLEAEPGQRVLRGQHALDE